MRDQKERGNRRVGIPNIPLRSAPWYLTVFTIITICLTVTNTLFIVVTEKIAGWPAVQYVVTGELLKAGGVSLITSPIISRGRQNGSCRNLVRPPRAQSS